MFSNRKTIAVVCVVLILCLSFIAHADEESRLITIDLDKATDEQLAAAIDLITQEQKARNATKPVLNQTSITGIIITKKEKTAKLVLDQTSITLMKGKTNKIVPQVTDLPNDVKIKKYSWVSSDKTIARVENGTVTGVKSGKAVITCTVQLSDGLELTQKCAVTIITAATGLSVKEMNLTLGIGQSYQLNPIIKPDDVTEKKLKYASDNKDIVTVTETGKVTAMHGGKATVTISTIDGSNKSVKVSFYVPSISASKTAFSVTQKSGQTFKIKYYGTRANLNVATTGNAGSVSHFLSGNDLSITVIPIKYGTITVTVSDKSDSRSKVALKITVEHSAVYDSTSYPRINYDSAARYPSSYRGDKCSFSGKVLQVMSGINENVYRISSKGRYDDVVYVRIKSSNITTPILEDDMVTVYGTYDGNYTYTAIFGQSITIPSVIAERIDVK